MKIAILTYINALNYGAVLQALALQSVLTDQGHEVSVLNYASPHIESVYTLDLNNRENKTVKIRLHSFVNRSLNNQKREAFQRFKAEYLNLTREYRTSYELSTTNEEFDLFITGSDQVFNDYCSNLDPAFFLSFVVNSKKKYTYASSFGDDNIPEHYKGIYKTFLSDFQNFSFREKSAISIIKDLINQKVHIDPDPTLLLDKAQWKSLLKLKKSKSKVKYIVVYYVKDYKELMNYARELKRRTGFKIVVFNFHFREMLLGKEIVRFSKGPDDFLRNLSNASYIITNSFHGTVFATLFNIPFLSEVSTKKGKNLRIQEYLESLNLKERILDGKDIDAIFQPVDWKEVQSTLKKRREKAIAYIRETF